VIRGACSVFGILSSEAGEGWSDNQIIEALETSASMVYRVRKQLVEEGLKAVLSRKPRAHAKCRTRVSYGGNSISLAHSNLSLLRVYRYERNSQRRKSRFRP
jgi:hypothetical protein